MFTKEYVGAILEPFVGKNIRMRSNEIIPFCLETSMESSFQIKLENMGVKFVLIDNFYIKRDLLKVFSGAFQEIDVFPFQLDSLPKEKVVSKGCENIIFNKIVEYMQKNMTPQIAYTYYGMITSLRVEVDRFFMNGIEFYVTKY